MSPAAQIRANARRPIFELSATTTTWPPRGHQLIDARLALVLGRGAGGRVDAVDAQERDVDADPLEHAGRQRPVSSYDCGRATPPVTTILMCCRTASSVAMFSAFVTTVSAGAPVTVARSARTARALATSVVVVPPFRPAT